MNPHRQEGIRFLSHGGDDGEMDGNCGQNKAFKTGRFGELDFYYFEDTSREGSRSTTLEGEEN